MLKYERRLYNPNSMTSTDKNLEYHVSTILRAIL
jgi:hypothetical protein